MAKVPTKLSSESSEFPWLMWGLALFSLIVAAHPHRLFDPVWIVSPQTPTLLGAATWTPGFAILLVAAGLGTLPLLFCGILMSVALTVLVRISSPQIPTAQASVWFSLIAISYPIEHTLLLVLTTAAVLLPTLRILQMPGRRFPAYVSLAILTASLTNCVAWPIGLLSLAVLRSSLSREPRFGMAKRILLPVVWFAGLIGAVIFVPGFGEQLIRPLMAVCTPQVQNVFPSWSLMPEHLLHWGLFVAFISLLLATIWKLCGPLSGEPAEFAPFGFAIVAGLSFVALGGWQALMLSGCSLAAWVQPRITAVPSRSKLVPVVCLVTAILFGGFQFQRFGIDLLVARLEDRRVDAALWNVSGRVLLTNLDQSTDWLSDDPRPPFSQLLDDRACPGPLLSTYAEVCMDWKNSRMDSYIRADGTWGGYRKFFRDWRPTVIVADAADLQSLRHLSLDPEWKVMGIDSRRVIFGSVNDETHIPQIRDASRLLMHLEFPGQRTPGELTRTVMLGTRVDAREVATVLNAMRLPYAALRVLPADQFSRTNEVRTWCYAELAHRCRSQSGQVSLLDQYRAMTGLKSIEASWSTSHAARRRIQRTIDSLALDDIGSATAVQTQEDKRHVAEDTDSSRGLRSAFASGDSDSVRTLLAAMPATSERQFFEAILAAAESEPGASARMLERVTESADLPANLRHEALFYFGCLAIETGDSESAVTRFRQSVDSLTSGLFSPLAEFFVLQLTTTQ